MSLIERWIEGAARRPAFQSARGLVSVFGPFFVVAVVVHYLRGDETWVGLLVAAVVAFISAACAVSLWRERQRRNRSNE